MSEANGKVNGAASVSRPDAGMRSLEHYSHRLPKWRRYLRDSIIPLVRWETPVLAKIQARYRSPFWDDYFAYTAILGTHTFFMVMLPILNWFGYHHMFRAMCQMLACGVFFSGYLKDLVCLPRPLSPPLTRISRSTSAALEYGFPSTHSTNAVSVVAYAFYVLHTTEEPWLQTATPYIQAFLVWYAISIFLGRLYCGMHGFLDVIVGSLLGGVIAAVQIMFEDRFNVWAIEGTSHNLVIITLVNLVLAFSGVFVGIQVGAWHFARTPFAWSEPMLSTTPFILAEIGWLKAVLRLFVGIAIIFAWRGIMKPTLFKVLPPIFRIVESLGLLLPRRFFLGASEYNRVPTLRKDDNVIPPVSEIPSMLNALGQNRKRTVSIGPQSEADAYEAMAFRQRRRRRESVSAPADLGVLPSPTEICKDSNENGSASARADSKSNGSASPGMPPSPAIVDSPAQAAEDQKEDEEMFRKLLRPRVRYDVEVLTKLIVYAGIGWIAVEGGPVVFESSGLGMR